MSYAENHRAVLNALAFLGPLSELEKVLRTAGDAERVVKTSQPEIDRLKQEATKAQGSLDLLREQVGEKRAELLRLGQEGEADVRRRVREVEQSLSEGLTKAVGDHQRQMKALTTQKESLEGELDKLAQYVQDLRQSKGSLEAQVATLRSELAKIAIQAGGADG